MAKTTKGQKGPKVPKKTPAHSGTPKASKKAKDGGFDKFANPKVGGAKLKEKFKQEKKTATKERRAAIEDHFEKKRQERSAQYEQRGQGFIDNPNQAGGKKGGKFDKKEFKKNDKSFKTNRKNASREKTDDKKAYVKPELVSTPREVQPFLPKVGTSKSLYGSPRPVESAKIRPGLSEIEKPIEKNAPTSRPVKPAAASIAAVDTKKPDFKKAEAKKPEISKEAPKKAAPKKQVENYTKQFTRPYTRKTLEAGTIPEEAPVKKTIKLDYTPKVEVKKNWKDKKQSFEEQKKPTDLLKGEMPLNKFIAHAGVCARRDAADLVRSGKITVNDIVVTEPGFKVNDGADVKFEGKKLQRSRNLVYILLNKPKDYITTSEDPQGRKTVMDIIKNVTTERVYPIGRLDRNTSGVLVLTNDGDLAQQLSHPSFGVRKMYEVKLDKPVDKLDFDKILKGITLEDGEIYADSLAYADAKDKSVIGIEIHSGRNRIVRRIFESLGYDVRSLDRVMYANLTKKNVERGKWRFLDEKEVRLLKYFKSSK